MQASLWVRKKSPEQPADLTCLRHKGFAGFVINKKRFDSGIALGDMAIPLCIAHCRKVNSDTGAKLCQIRNRSTELFCQCVNNFNWRFPASPAP